MNVSIEVSARHLHITQSDLEVLFGEGYKLEPAKDLSQPGEFASTAEVSIVGPKDKLDNVRIVGPCRNHTQIELSRTDCYHTGIDAPLRLSGKIIGSGACKLVGPAGELELEEGVIVAKRHIHMNLAQAHQLGVSNAQTVKVSVEGPRALVFDEVELRVKEEYDLSMHVDTDEANASGIKDKVFGEIIVT